MTTRRFPHPKTTPIMPQRGCPPHNANNAHNARRGDPVWSPAMPPSLLAMPPLNPMGHRIDAGNSLGAMVRIGGNGTHWGQWYALGAMVRIGGGHIGPPLRVWAATTMPTRAHNARRGDHTGAPAMPPSLLPSVDAQFETSSLFPQGQRRAGARHFQCRVNTGQYGGQHGHQQRLAEQSRIQRQIQCPAK